MRCGAAVADKQGVRGSAKMEEPITAGGRLLVTVSRPGPLRLRMRLDVSGRHAVVQGFEPAPDGGIGELEADGRVEENDILESINGVSLMGRSLEDILLQISRAARNSDLRTLTFLKSQSRLSQPAVTPDKAAATASATAPAADVEEEADVLPEPPLVAPVSVATPDKAQPFRVLLRETLINEGRLRNQASQGIPDSQGLRGVIWRLLLKYLPLETGLWPEYLADKREEYASATRRLIQSTPYTSYFPSSTTTASATSAAEAAAAAAAAIAAGRASLKPGVLVKVDDDPLRTSDASAWATYFADTTLMDEIQKDVVRTHPDINFFNTEPVGIHQSVMQRILFIYAKVHPSVRYVQGMNELCGTLYFVFASDEDEEFAQHAEADTYHCFCLLVNEMQDVFIRQKDSCDGGIIARIKEFTDLLQSHDPDLHGLLEFQGIDAAFYGLRWLTTILSREFNLPDTIRLWDTLFSDTNRNEFLAYLCCTMILEQHDKLMIGDFAENLGLLQDYPDTDVNVLLEKSTRLRSKDFVRRTRHLTGKGEGSLGCDSPDSSFEATDTPHLRLIASLKSAAGAAAGAAGSSLSELKSAAGARLQGARALLAEGRDALGARMSGVRTWFAVTREGGKESEDMRM